MGCAPRWRRSRQHTAENDTLALWIAFDYGGRAELVDAARSLIADGIAVDDVDEEALAGTTLCA